MIGRCNEPGCETLTIGSRCLRHDEPVTRTFVRGRPFVMQGRNQNVNVYVDMAPPERPVDRATRQEIAA